VAILAALKDTIFGVVYDDGTASPSCRCFSKFRASATAARVEAALFSGDVRHLPVVRSGLRAMAGARPVEVALHTLAHAVIIP